jgi:hypothetical protein
MDCPMTVTTTLIHRLGNSSGARVESRDGECWLSQFGALINDATELAKNDFDYNDYAGILVLMSISDHLLPFIAPLQGYVIPNTMDLTYRGLLVIMIMAVLLHSKIMQQAVTLPMKESCPTRALWALGARVRACLSAGGTSTSEQLRQSIRVDG